MGETKEFEQQINETKSKIAGEGVAGLAGLERNLTTKGTILNQTTNKLTIAQVKKWGTYEVHVWLDSLGSAMGSVLEAFECAPFFLLPSFSVV